MFYFDSPQKKNKKTPANQRLSVFGEGGGWEGGEGGGDQKGKLRRKGLIRSKF